MGLDSEKMIKTMFEDDSLHIGKLFISSKLILFDRIKH